VVYAGMCDKLFDIDEKLRIVPQLATGYEYPDATHLVIHLRPNVTFHDGEPCFDGLVRKMARPGYSLSVLRCGAGARCREDG
jgi:hypothetical protein